MPHKTPEEDKRFFERRLIKRKDYAKYWEKRLKGEDAKKLILRETYIKVRGKRRLVARDYKGRFAKRFS